jgi:hypothetical protein
MPKADVAKLQAWYALLQLVWDEATLARSDSLSYLVAMAMEEILSLISAGDGDLPPIPSALKGERSKRRA